MERYYNIDIDNLISDHKLAYENAYENVTDQLKQLYNNRIKLYAQKIDENFKISSNYIFLIFYNYSFLYFIY